jgi:hypothetical protein
MYIILYLQLFVIQFLFVNLPLALFLLHQFMLHSHRIDYEYIYEIIDDNRSSCLNANTIQCQLSSDHRLSIAINEHNYNHNNR